MGWDDVLVCFPEKMREELISRKEGLREIRVRAKQPLELVSDSGRSITGPEIDAETLRSIALNMMEHSYYAREPELSQGYFTMTCGWRVGVCGSFTRHEDGRISLRSIGSICIRVAREVQGCAQALVNEMMRSGDIQSALILSRPGFGKTTMLRDAARMLSEQGQAVAIADERHELAACRDGIPMLNVGQRTDVIDGCDKHAAMRMLVRSMAPRIIITDEIGSKDDIREIRYAARRGVSVLTSAHASSMEDLQRGELRPLLDEKVFSTIVLLDGEPGRIERIWRF